MYENENSSKIDYHSLGNKKILLAEDVAFNQYIARQMLESWGFEVSLASNGVEVLGLLQHSDFDCILMDIQMPEMDGMEAARRIRKLPDAAKASVPIIAVTANALRGDCEKYLAAGMSDFLAKPLEESKLFMIISKNLPSENIPAPVKKDAPLDNEFKVDTMAPLYDLSMVESISGGDKVFIKKMVELFIETVPPNVSDLNKALNKGDWDQVAKMAHKLKSTVDSMGIQSLKTDIRTVETNAKAKESLQEIPALVSKIGFVINRCIAQLKIDIL